MITVKGSHINETHPDIIGCKSLSELKKLNIFSGLSKVDADLANEELFALLNPKKKELKEDTRD
jgi:hypothetical protein